MYFLPKNFTVSSQNSMGWIWELGSKIRDSGFKKKLILDPETRSRSNGKKAPILDPDPEHW